MSEKNKNAYVKWQVFAWTVAIVSLLLSGVYAVANGASEVAQNNKVEIKGIQSTITSEFYNIKKSLDRIEGTLDKHSN